MRAINVLRQRQSAAKNHNKKGIREENSNQEKSPMAEVNPRLEVEEVQSQYISRVFHLKVGAVEANSAAISELNIERSAPTSETSNREREKPGTGVSSSMYNKLDNENLLHRTGQNRIHRKRFGCYASARGWREDLSGTNEELRSAINRQQRTHYKSMEIAIHRRRKILKNSENNRLRGSNERANNCLTERQSHHALIGGIRMIKMYSDFLRWREQKESQPFGWPSFRRLA